MVDQSTFRDKLIIILQDDAAILTNPGDLNAAIASAVEHYSKDRGYEKIDEFSGDNGYDYDLPSDWVLNFSKIVSIEYPSGYQVPYYLEEEDWEIYWESTSTQKLRFLDATPSSTETVRVRYTIPHTVSASASTVYDEDFEAVCHLACAYACKFLANKMVQTSEPTIAADVVDYASKTEQYKDRAEEMFKEYRRLMKLEGDVNAPSSIVKDFDTDLSFGELHLTHPKEYR